MEKDEEVFDVVNEKDEVVGQATRIQCHNNPALMHHTVQFAVYSEKSQKFLIARRSVISDAAANQLAFFGEHIMAGETYEDALKRGLKEELGIGNFIQKYLGETNFKNDKQHEKVKFYLITINNQNIRLDEKEVTDEFWLTKEEVISKVDEFANQTQYWIKNVLN